MSRVRNFFRRRKVEHMRFLTADEILSFYSVFDEAFAKELIQEGIEKKEREIAELEADKPEGYEERVGDLRESLNALKEAQTKMAHPEDTPDEPEDSEDEDVERTQAVADELREMIRQLTLQLNEISSCVQKIPKDLSLDEFENLTKTYDENVQKYVTDIIEDTKKLEELYEKLDESSRSKVNLVDLNIDFKLTVTYSEVTDKIYELGAKDPTSGYLAPLYDELASLREAILKMASNREAKIRELDALEERSKEKYRTVRPDPVTTTDGPDRSGTDEPAPTPTTPGHTDSGSSDSGSSDSGRAGGDSTPTPTPAAPTPTAPVDTPTTMTPAPTPAAPVDTPTTSTPEAPTPAAPTPTPRTFPTDEEYQRLKQKYIDDVNMINTTVEFVEDLTTQEISLLAADVRDIEKINRLEESAKKANEKIFNIKTELIQLDYDYFMTTGVLISLDPDVKIIRQKNVNIVEALDPFVNKINAEIKNTYQKVVELNQKFKATTNEDEKNAIKEETNTLFKYVNNLKSLISRRLLVERQNNPSFDMIGYMKTHMVKVPAGYNINDTVDLDPDKKKPGDGPGAEPTPGAGPTPGADPKPAPVRADGKPCSLTLNLKTGTEKVNREKALVTFVSKVQITELKTKIKVAYKKFLVEELKGLKIAIQAKKKDNDTLVDGRTNKDESISFDKKDLESLEFTFQDEDSNEVGKASIKI